MYILFNKYSHVCVYVYARGCILLYCLYARTCCDVCTFFRFLTKRSTTQDEYDKSVLQNHRYYGKQLICKTCRHGDGRVDRNLYFCADCNALKDREHFTKTAMDNWKRRGRKEDALKCVSHTGRSSSVDTIFDHEKKESLRGKRHSFKETVS